MSDDPDLGRINRGHVCKHGVRWPHPCQPCDDAAWDAEQKRSMTARVALAVNTDQTAFGWDAA